MLVTFRYGDCHLFYAKVAGTYFIFQYPELASILYSLLHTVNTVTAYNLG